MAEASERSIHWRQRWWYALWVSLLLGALGFWAWWERPAVSGTGHVVLMLRVADVPPGSQVASWAGPAKAWPSGGAFQGPWAVQDPAKPLPLPPVEIHAGMRRWHFGYIPRLTSDLIVIRIAPPGGAPRFVSYNLFQDINTGVAGPHRRMFVSAPLRWSLLSEDASRPSALLP